MFHLTIWTFECVQIMDFKPFFSCHSSYDYLIRNTVGRKHFESHLNNELQFKRIKYFVQSRKNVKFSSMKYMFLPLFISFFYFSFLLHLLLVSFHTRPNLLTTFRVKRTTKVSLGGMHLWYVKWPKQCLWQNELKCKMLFLRRERLWKLLEKQENIIF